MSRTFWRWTAAILGFTALLIAALCDTAVSHKAEVIRCFLRGQSPAAIARELNHSQHAVGRYLKDSAVPRTLVQKFPLHEIPALAKHAPSLMCEPLSS